MKTVLLRYCSLALFCALRASTSAADGRDITPPLSPLSPQQMKECDQLQSQWDSLTQQLETEHQACLDAHAKDPAVPGASFAPSDCSRRACQGLHTQLYGWAKQESQSQVKQCRDQVSQYQQQQSQQQAATQQAVQLSQQQFQQQVNLFRDMGQRAASQSRQRQTAQKSAQESARDQRDRMDAQLKSAARARIDQLRDQQAQQANSGLDQADTRASNSQDGAPSNVSPDSGSSPNAQTPSPQDLFDQKAAELRSVMERESRLQAQEPKILEGASETLGYMEEQRQGALTGMGLGVAQMAKGGIDAIVNVGGEFAGPEGTIVKAAYGVLNEAAGKAGNAIANSGEGSAGGNGEGGNHGIEAAKFGLETTGAAGEIAKAAGKELETNGNWTKSILGLGLTESSQEGLQKYGENLAVVGAGGKLLGAYAAHEQGDNVLAGTKAASALATGLGSKVGGKVTGTLEGTLEGGKSILNGWDTFKDYFQQYVSMPDRMQNYAATIAAQDQQRQANLVDLAQQHAALQSELLQLMSQPGVVINVNTDPNLIYLTPPPAAKNPPNPPVQVTPPVIVP
jgi:hypothetical protein